MRGGEEAGFKNDEERCAVVTEEAKVALDLVGQAGNEVEPQ